MRSRLLGHSSSERIGRLVTDVVHQTIDGGMTEIRMSEPVLNALVDASRLPLRCGLREPDRDRGVRQGRRHSWRLVGEGPPAPGDYLDLRTVEAEGVDIAAQDFLAGMTDRYAVRLFEQLFIPKPWVEIGAATGLTRTRRAAYNH